jgi:hypothetical protein
MDRTLLPNGPQWSSVSPQSLSYYPLYPPHRLVNHRRVSAGRMSKKKDMNPFFVQRLCDPVGDDLRTVSSGVLSIL